MSFVKLYQFKDESQIPGYIAESTAPSNVEDIEQATLCDQDNRVKLVNDAIYQPIKVLAADLLNRLNGHDVVELVIAIHGYNTGLGFLDWFWDIWEHANNPNNHIASSDSNNSITLSNRVFLGYRWTSEKFDLKTVPLNAIVALPILLGILLISSIISLILVIKFQLPLWAFCLCSILIFFGNLVIMVMLLRISGYFRDAYRATHYGVPDLVDLIQELDCQLVQMGIQDNNIKLSFIAHSMGAFVTTNVVRIISDVFYDSSREINTSNPLPPREIGKAFRLGRLVMASPDIPVGSIFSGRSNFLRASLRRFEESYLFCNEGDLVLRIASTAANYFSFPTKQRVRGHRLGNLTVKPKADWPKYGVVNQSEFNISDDRLQDLLVNSLEVNTLCGSKTVKQLQKKNLNEKPIAELFTYFDCTNYYDAYFRGGKKRNKFFPQPKFLLSFPLDWFPPLNFAIYTWLVLKMISGGIDVHGGYFQGKVTRQLIYGLAFVGFREFVHSLPSSNPTQAADPKDLLAGLSTLTKEVKIQVLLSQERYRVDLLEQDLNEVRVKLLNLK